MTIATVVSPFRQGIFWHLALLSLLVLWLSACEKKEENQGNDNSEPPSDTPYEQYGQPFSNIPQTAELVIYEVNLRAYSPEGDLRGVIARLDEIKALGVNVIWLMPIHPVGQEKGINSPYCIRNYKAVAAEYGSLSDLRALTDEAHKRGMAVIMDWVANHTAWDHPWISNKNWYTQDSNGNIVHPPGTNWQDVADLNYDNQQMRNAMLDAMFYWPYAANIDGYRCDYADGVPYDFWQTAIDSIEKVTGRNLIWFAEGSKKTHFVAGFDLCFGWHFYGTLKSVWQGDEPIKLISAHDQEYQNTPAGKHWLRFTTNHDESAWDATPVSIFNGNNGALAASVISIFTGGAVLIYGSQEVGTNNNIPFFSNSLINWSANPEMKEAYEEILAFYNSSDAARYGNITASTAFPDVLIFEKSYEGEEIAVIVNVRNQNSKVGRPSELAGINWQNVLTGQAVNLGNVISLAPYEYLVLKN